MNNTLFKKIKRANSKYAEYLSACDKVAKVAQKHINWNDNVGCAYIPSDGLCIEIEGHVCPATRFFELPEIIGDDMIDGKPYNEIVDEARKYINNIGGFEKFAEWGLY